MKTKSELRIAIIGGGIGGASAAVALKAKGIRADVYEQAPAFSRSRRWYWYSSTKCSTASKNGVYTKT